jgi:hypothetical protein
VASDTPNLFLSLFEFHPRGTHTPKENFLTEAFAYLLRTESGVRNAWLSRLLGRPVAARECVVNTRQSEPDPELGSTAYPDLVLRGRLTDGTLFHVYCEHKWDSQCNAGQLARYKRLGVAKGAQLAFVGATINQRREAAACFPDGDCNCFQWEQVFESLKGVPDLSPLASEFLDFLEEHGLSPGKPLTVEQMRAFLGSAGFLETLARFAALLHENYSWEVIPKRYHANCYVEDRWGRVTVCFDTQGWKPGLSLGFLYSVHDHKVRFVNPGKGIDLMLRIGAIPKDTRETRIIQPVLDVLERKRQVLRNSAGSVLLLGEPGNGNRHSLLIVRDCLADVIADASTEQDQLIRIHDRLHAWLTTLFADGELEAAFRQTPLSAGLEP